MTLPCGLGVETYDRDRFFTLTGHHLPGTPLAIENRQAELEVLHRQLFDNREKPRPEDPRSGPTSPLDLDDQEIIDRAHQAANGAKFAKLWAGNWEAAGYPSQSEADLALAEMLAFWCGPDSARIERLFSQSGLGQRDKWQKRADYRDRTIREALARMTEFYTPGGQEGVKRGGGRKDTQGEHGQGPEGETRHERSQTHRSAPRNPGIRLVTGAELMTMEFRMPMWIVPDILPEEFVLLAARPKKGKSLLALNFAVAKATGGCALSRPDLRLEPAKVLYLALEDRLHRMKQRLQKLLPEVPFPDNLIIAETWPRLDKGGLEDLTLFLKENNDCRLVVIDSYIKVRP
ncbi:MAG: AAA family ATPase, partial [Syntrophobacterales bacterium]|nr:AAA family ATPase [Syntrophobacterales bacterium]